MHAGVVATHEFRCLTRNRAAHWAALAVPALLMALVVVHWPADGQVDLSGRRAAAVFEVFAYGLLLAVLVVAPLLAATSIVRDRQRRTLLLMLTSPLRPMDLVIGKLLAIVAALLVVMLVSLPAAAACHAMGGVDGQRQVGALYVLLIALAIFLASMGLLVSTLVDRLDAAVRIVFFACGLMVLAPLVPFHFLRPLAGAAWDAPLLWLRDVSPLPAVLEITARGTPLTSATDNALTRFVVIMICGAVIALAWTWRALSKPALDRSRAAGVMTDDRSAGVQWMRGIMYLGIFDPMRRKRPIGNFTNPVLVKELRVSRLGRSRWLARLFVLVLIVSLGLTVSASRLSMVWGTGAIIGGVLMVQMAAILLLTPALAATLLASERESGSWRLLQMTPLHTVRIMTGKISAVLVLLFIVLLATVPALLVLVLIEERSGAGVRMGLVMLGLATLHTLFIAAAAGAFFARTSTATLAGFAAVLGPIVVSFFAWSREGIAFGRETVSASLVINPVAATLAALQVGGFERYDIIEPARNYMIVTGAIGLAVWLLLVQRLRRPAGVAL